MIEANALLAMFTVQILAMSVLVPDRLIKQVRVQVMKIPAERFAQLYPDFPVVDRDLTLKRYLAWYRVLNLGIAVLGLWMLGWLFTYTQRPDWKAGEVKDWVVVYWFAQWLPFLLAAWVGVRHNKLLENSLDGKRKAILQRRGLFDFVSPFTVFLAVLAYLLFVAYVIHFEQNPLSHIIGITLICAVHAFAAYRTLYATRVNPYVTHAAREYAIGLGVKASVYLCFYFIVRRSINLTIEQLDLQRWKPFTESSLFVLLALGVCVALVAEARRSELDGLGHSPVR